VGSDRPLVARGQRAVESDQRGRAADRFETAAASDETDPAVLELSRPSAGGRGESGVAGAAKESGVSARGRRTGSDTAATRSAARHGSGRASVRASRQNEYFRRMYERVDRLVIYPRELALSLEQGVVVVIFTLHADGHISDLSVAKSSGFKEFDSEVKKALARAAPFGEVPAAVRGTSDRVSIKAPYTFSNPLIR
jgi:TonB family protein